MVFSRQLVISIGVSALSATLLFLYFRNRMTNVERKVDVMLDLIQSHESDRQMSQSYMAAQHESQSPSSQQNTDNWNMQNSQERNLIDVSDDEDDSEYDSEDSREVSDNEDDLAERIKLVTTDIDVQEAEEEKNVVVLENTNDEPISIDESVQLEEVTNNLEEDDVMSDNKEDNKEIVQKLEEEDSLVEDSLEEDSESDTEQEPIDEEETPLEYNKLRVSELKALAEAKGLLNYKSLKKQPLIDLIKASE
jgi:hypothetical protein